MTAETVTSEELARRLGEALAEESAHATRVRVGRGGHIYNCGDHDPSIYLIESGQVKTLTYSPDGKQCLLSIYASGDIFGELCMACEGRTETATAMRSTCLRRIPYPRLRAAMHDGDLMEAFLAHLTRRLSEQQQIITNLVTMDSERRLASALLTLAQKLGKEAPRGTRIDQRITQEELSGMVGTTRSRVGYFLKRFCEAGLVQRPPGSFLVVNENNLVDYLEGA